MSSETSEGLEARIVDSVNRARRDRRLQSLGSSPLLTLAARQHSRTMAELEFFSHHSPVAGCESVSDRVRRVGGEFDSVGENLAMHPVHRASAAEFVEGWLNSPGHRRNLERPDWEVTGVGTYDDGRGNVFATQLFGIPAVFVLDPPILSASRAHWYMLAVTAKVGRGHSLGAFLRNQWVGSAKADRQGIAELKVEIPAVDGCHHLDFARQRSGSADGWVGIYEGSVVVENTDASWLPGRPEPGCCVIDERFCRMDGSLLNVVLSGRAEKPGILAVDGQEAAQLHVGPFRHEVTWRSSSGTHSVHLGRPLSDNQYAIHRAFEVDTSRGDLRETTRNQEAG